MLRVRAIVLPLLLLSHVAAAQPAPASASRAVTRAVGTGPMRFEPNHGQTDPRVKFLARGEGYSLFLTAADAVFRLRDERVLRLRLLGAKSTGGVDGETRLAGVTNYLRGVEREWKTGIPAYARVRYTGVYDGIDLVYYGNERQLEYDFVVAPGADPGAIKLRFDGADRLRIDRNGDLVVRVGKRELRQRRPVAYQDVAGVRRTIRAAHVLAGKNSIAFRLGEYDARLPLIIDPVLLYSTYLGGPGELFGASTIAVDDSGAAYVAGSTTSPEFPTTPGAFRSTNNGGGLGCGFCDAFVSKFDPDGALLYSTYLGGHGSNSISTIAVSPAGEAYVAGTSTAVDFPTTPGAVQETCTPVGPGVPAAGRCNAGFVSRLDATGAALLFSTYIGGDGITVTGYGSYVSGIALDADLNIFLTGATSPNFPITAGAFQPTYTGSYITGYVAKMNAEGTAFLYSSYLGGHGGADTPTKIAVDSGGNAYVTGYARSTDFPTTPGAFQRTCAIVETVGGCWIAFVTKVNSVGTALVYSTLLGGFQTVGFALNGISSEGWDVAVDPAGFAYVTGESNTMDFPTTPGSLKTSSVTWDAFVTKINLDGTGLVYSTYLGGDVTDLGASGYEVGSGIEVDAQGQAYVVGSTSTFDFPQVDPLQPQFGHGFRDAFVAQLNATGSDLIFSTYLGGSGDDEAFALARHPGGDLIVAGATQSTDFPVVNAAFPTSPGTAPLNRSNFVAKIGAPVCGTEVTGAVTVFRSAIVPFFPPFNLQLAIVWNSSPSPIEGPVAYVMDDLQDAVFVGRSSTRCFSPEGDPLTLVPLGDDNVLAPNEARLLGLFFYRTQPGTIGYTPRLLSGRRNY